MRAVLIICDGMADRPVPELANKTPLEIAHKPNMDWLAKHGVCGIMDTVEAGVPPGSDTAHLALLGYNPFEVYTGRGPFEAAGAGIELKPGDIAFRANFATVDEKGIIVDRRAGRIQEAKLLEEAISKIKIKGVEIIFKATIGHRGVLVLRGKGLSHEVSDSDPHATGVKPLKIFPKLIEEKRTPEYPLIAGGVRKLVIRRSRALKTAKILNEFSRKAHEVLRKHEVNLRRIKEGKPPANYILLRGPGVVPHLSSLEERTGLKGACVAAAALVKGVCRLAGMTVPDVPGATGSVNTDLASKVKTTLKLLEDHDIVLLHIKGLDEASHDHDPRKKVEFIEKIDSILPQLIEATDFILLTADHTTPVSVGDHTADPVPVVIYGPGVRVDDVEKFGERDAAKGGLGRINGRHLLPILADLMGKSHKFGA
ncbi:MAG: 2,3-bisphosphoglycerate-independent phosphoglycerate mutase [Candidatus Hadarchaeales archaeon]